MKFTRILSHQGCRTTVEDSSRDAALKTLELSSLNDSGLLQDDFSPAGTPESSGESVQLALSAGPQATKVLLLEA